MMAAGIEFKKPDIYEFRVGYEKEEQYLLCAVDRGE